MMIRKLIIVLLFVPFVSVYGQEPPSFADMVGDMTDQSLPLMNITDLEGELNTDNFEKGKLVIAEFQKEPVQYIAKFRIRGGASTGLGKNSLAIKLIDDDGEDVDAAFWGIRGEKPDNSWILDAMGFDRIRMRNRVCFDLWNEMSKSPYDTDYGQRNGTEGQFVEVFINGTYHGLYCMSDKIDRKLLNLKKFKEKNNKITIKGLIYKGVSWQGSGSSLLSYDNTAQTNKKTWDAWELEYPDDYPSDQTWQPLKDLIDFCSANTNDEDFLGNYTSYFYTSNLADYMVMTMALNVVDNLYKNTFLSVPDITEGHRYLLTPWDMDASLGGQRDGDRNDELCNVTRYNETAPYNRLYVQNMDNFADAVKKKWLELQITTFSIEHVHSVLDAYAAMFVSSGAWEREYAKWGGNQTVPLAANLSDELSYVKSWYETNFKHLCDSWGWRGDVNGDLKVDMNDVNLLCDIIMGKTTEFEFNKADVNLDGSINASDIVEAIRLMPEAE